MADARSTDPPRKPRSVTPWLAPATIVLLTLAAYFPALRAGAIWDDDRYVTGNALVQSEDGLPRIWFSSEPADYYPVTYTSFWLEWRMWGADLKGYHATNVMLHAANALLVWLLLRSLGIPGAWLAGMLFAVHPINVESVAWISQRKNVLGMLFFLLSATAFLRWDRNGRFRLYCLALLFFALSLMSKPIAAALPGAIVVYRWWARGGLRRAVVDAVPFAALAALYGLMTVMFQQTHSIQGEDMGAATSAGILFAASRALFFYVAKTLWPLRLCPVYPEWNTDVVTVANVLPVILLGAVVGLAARYRDKWGRSLLFSLACYVLLLLPVLGISDVGFMFYSLVADHWVYAAMPAVLAPLAFALARMQRGKPSLQQAVAAISAALVLVLAVLCHRQCAIYKDMRSYFTATVERNPAAWVGHLWLGNLAFSDGDLDEAEQRYDQTLRLKPGYWEALNGLGIVHAVRGEVDEAIALFRQVLARRPDHASARSNLQIALGEKRRKQEAAAATPRDG